MSGGDAGVPVFPKVVLEDESRKVYKYPSGCEGNTFHGLFRVEWINDQTGYGCIASKDIPKHTLLLEEQPLLSGASLQEALEKHETGIHLCHQDDVSYLNRSCGLSQEIQSKLWLMHDQYHDQYNQNDDNQQHHLEQQKRLWGIVYSNAFFNSDRNFEPGLYFVAAKFNHSCRPNVGYDFSGHQQRLWTTRDVKQGQELVDCYSDVVYHFPARVRKAFLESKYNFDCRCEACSIAGLQYDGTSASDGRRERLGDIARMLSHQLGVDFLYNDAFEEQVWDVAEEVLGETTNLKMNGLERVNVLGATFSNNSLPKSLQGHGTNFRCSYQTATKLSFTNPKQYHLDAILEYIQLLEEEGIDHDCLECYELAYDFATFLGRSDYLEQFSLHEKCLNLYKLSKGPKHKATKKFRNKLQKNCHS